MLHGRPDFETETINVNSSPSSSLMITTDSPLISTSSGEVPASDGKRGEHNFANLIQRCVKSFRDLGFKNEV
jgi:hypothetical protein